MQPFGILIKKAPQNEATPAKISQTLQDMLESGSGLLEHQNWSIWWKNTGRRAKYGNRDFEAEKEFRLFDILTKKNT